jgi:2-keto-3-deoxy-L-rhamnonate aldolase RhmA
MEPYKPFAGPLKGTLLSVSAPQVPEIIASAGFDWVLIDMEHSAISLENVQNAIQVMGDRVMKIVRVPGNDEIWIKRVLDTGCDGILVPMVNSAAEAIRAVNFAKYPPQGKRSVGLSRAHAYGPGFNGYVKNANRDLILMVQVEHRDAVSNLDEILMVDGIDSFFIGPYDLSASMGLTGQLTHPDVVSSINTVKTKCRKAGKPWGIFGMSPDALATHVSDGCTFILCGVDVAIMVDSYRELIEELKVV